uniref:Uncharacterized protein n=1 Tax=Arundo donax TaxID=35708 RepID=A0A0A9AUV9_ARUDO
MLGVMLIFLFIQRKAVMRIPYFLKDYNFCITLRL